MKNELPKQAFAHIIERPSHIDLLNGNSRKNKLIWVAQTLKLMDRTKTLCYDEDEFAHEFSGHKAYPTYMKKRLQQLGVKKPRIVKDSGKVYIYSNDERG